jgi:hypothetical protein
MTRGVTRPADSPQLISLAEDGTAPCASGRGRPGARRRVAQTDAILLGRRTYLEFRPSCGRARAARCRCRPSSRRADVLGHLLEPGLGPTGEEHARALASEGSRDRAADRSTAPIDHRCLAFEQHVRLPQRRFSLSTGPRRTTHWPGAQPPTAAHDTRRHERFARLAEATTE